MGKVRPEIPLAFARIRALEVHYPDRPWVEARYIPVSAGFYKHGVARVAEPGRQLVYLRLQKRLTAGQLDQVAIVTGDLVHYLVQGHCRAAGKSELGITPFATQVASGRPHKDAG